MLQSREGLWTSQMKIGCIQCAFLQFKISLAFLWTDSGSSQNGLSKDETTSLSTAWEENWEAFCVVEIEGS